MGNEKKGIVLTRKTLAIILAAAAAVVAVAGVAVGSVIASQKKAALAAREEAEQAKAEAEAVIDTYQRPTVGADGRIGYAADVITSDPETLQKAVDEMYEKAKEPGVSLQYKEMAISDDGKHFSCFLGNSERNDKDMFLAIYADPELTDELFLSELLRPGSRFEEIEISRTLEPGEYEAYLVHTQVADEEQNGEYVQAIQAQVATTLKLVVNEPKS